MRAVLYHMPFQPVDTVRVFKLEVQIGGEVFYEELSISKMEYTNARNIDSCIKRTLVDRCMNKIKEKIYQQIGEY